MLILKKEINAAMDTSLELVKWKLIILAVLTTAGLGLMQGFEHFNYGYLLLLVSPYVCAYVDLLVYEREARVHYIARYLRHYAGTNPDGLELRRYEEYIHSCRRTTGWVPHEGWARFASSLIASIGIPLLTLTIAPYHAAMHDHAMLWSIPGMGLVCVVYIYVRAQRQLHWIDHNAPKPAP